MCSGGAAGPVGQMADILRFDSRFNLFYVDFGDGVRRKYPAAGGVDDSYTKTITFVEEFFLWIFFNGKGRRC